MENTKENKARLFGVYFGQPIMRCKILNNNSPFQYSALMKVDINSETLNYNWHLVLKPIETISDSSLAEIADEFKISIGSHFCDEYKDLGEFRKAFMIRDDDSWPISFFDALRSKGYALPYNRLPVADQIVRGWITLK